MKAWYFTYSVTRSTAFGNTKHNTIIKAWKGLHFCLLVVKAETREEAKRMLEEHRSETVPIVVDMSRVTALPVKVIQP